MGRAKLNTKKPKKLSFKTKEAMHAWQTKKSNPRWNDLKDYNPKHRLWVNMIGGGVAMVDAESYTDHDGDEMYRMVYLIGPSGRPSIEYGQIRVFLEHGLKCAISPVIDPDTSVALDQWIKSAKEDVPVTLKDGWNDRICQIEPCRVKGLQWISQEKVQDNLKKNISEMTRMFMSGMFD
jgi:hypothetical protein